jgi:hypothetical protein
MYINELKMLLTHKKKRQRDSFLIFVFFASENGIEIILNIMFLHIRQYFLLFTPEQENLPFDPCV